MEEKMVCTRENNHQSSESNNTPFVQIHILVVDDDATTLAIVAAFLKLWHYQVMTVNNPHDALETLRNKRGFFDLVVTDLHMPNMNGFELQKRIAEEFNLPVIMMSADDKKSVISKCLKDGAAFYLVKPIKPNDVKNLWQYAVTAQKRNTLGVREIQSGVGAATSSSSSAASAVGHQLKNENRSKKRKAEDMEYSQLEVTSVARKKRKVFWTSELHGRFVMAVKQIGLDQAVPKRILDIMSVPGLTRENVASHLQKYRLFLKKATRKDYIDQSADRILRSSFANGVSPDVLQSIRSAHPPYFGEQQMGLASSPGIHGGDMASLNINPSVAPLHLPNQLQASSSATTLPQLLYGQSSNAAHGLAHQQNQFAPAASNRQLRIGQSNNWNNQANLFLCGYKPALQTSGSVNTARLKGSDRHGFMNNSYDVLTDRNLMQTWPQKTQAYPSLLAAKNTMLSFPQQSQANPGLLSVTNTMQNNHPQPSEDNLGINNYNGIHENGNLSYAQNNPNLGSVASANQGLNTNSCLSNNSSGVLISCTGAGQNGNVLPNGSSYNNFDSMNEAEDGGKFSAPMRNDTAADIFQGGFSSAGATQLSVSNPPENTSRLTSQPQQQCGGGNAGGIDEIVSNPMADGGTILENSQVEEVDADELVKLFLMLEDDDIFIDLEQQGEGILNPESNPKETGMPDGVANLNSSLSPVEQYLNQQQGSDGVPGMNVMENAASKSNQSAAMDWDMELLDDLLGTAPNQIE